MGSNNYVLTVIDPLDHFRMALTHCSEEVISKNTDPFSLFGNVLQHDAETSVVILNSHLLSCCGSKHNEERVAKLRDNK